MKFKKSLLLAIITALALVFSSCFAEDGGYCNLTVVNSSSTTIYGLWVSPSSSSSWGSDQLSGSIASGSSYTIYDIPAGKNYDLLATDSNSTTSYTEYWVESSWKWSDGYIYTWTLYDKKRSGEDSTTSESETATVDAIAESMYILSGETGPLK